MQEVGILQKLHWRELLSKAIWDDINERVSLYPAIHPNEILDKEKHSFRAGKSVET